MHMDSRKLYPLARIFGDLGLKTSGVQQMVRWKKKSNVIWTCSSAGFSYWGKRDVKTTDVSLGF